MTHDELPPELSGATVVAVDDSPSAREALRWAAGHLSSTGSALVVLSVWNFVTARAPQQGQDTPPSKQAWQAEAERRLADLLAQELPGAGDRVRALAVHGNTTPTLIEVSRRATHLVVGSRGRGGFTGLLLGSTTEQLVRHACCPITVVREGTTGPAA